MRYWAWVGSLALFGASACGRATGADAGTPVAGSGANAGVSAGGNANSGGGAPNTASGGAGSASGGTATATMSPPCSFPENLVCNDHCTDTHSDPRDCGGCGRACGAGERCVSAKCLPPLSCTAATTVYDLDGIEGELEPGETLRFEHTFQKGPVTLKFRARASRTDRWPRMQVLFDSTVLGAMPVTSSSVGSYEFALESDEGPHTISVSHDGIGTQPAPHLSVLSLDVEDCTDMQRTCAGGGKFYSESNSCAPFACDSAADCVDAFPGPTFVGTCQESACSFPKCSSLAPLQLAPELAYRCLSYAELVYSYGYPHVANLQGRPDDFECPAVSALTWQVVPFRGEGSCAEGPVCGPDRPREVGLSQADQNLCCYLMARVCGV